MYPIPEVLEMTNVGLKLLIDDEEFFLSYVDYPWFKEASTEHISNIVRRNSEHLRWPLLDVDLSVDSIRHPDKYPLKAKAM